MLSKVKRLTTVQFLLILSLMMTITETFDFSYMTFRYRVSKNKLCLPIVTK